MTEKTKVSANAGRARVAVRRCASGGSAGAGRIMIGGARDPDEKAADRVADRVMRMTTPARGLHRKCAACDVGERKADRQPMDVENVMVMTRRVARSAPVAPGTAAAPASPSAARAIGALGSGRPLASAERAFFEPRFGTNLSTVRVHDGPQADRAGRAIDGGRRLMAHELAHIVDGSAAGSRKVQRLVGGNSVCPASVHDAPANPLGRLTQIDAEATRMALGAHHMLAVVSVDLTFFPTVTRAYRRRFGNPPAATGGRFRNRFTGRLFNTQDAALRSEMGTASNLFGRIGHRFEQNIRYRCSGTSRIKLENCSPAACAADDVAMSCPGTSLRDIQICPGFWVGLSDRQMAGALIHEVVHGELNRTGHPQAANRRHRNPECFTSFVAEIYGFTPFDVRCPRI